MPDRYLCSKLCRVLLPFGNAPLSPPTPHGATIRFQPRRHPIPLIDFTENEVPPSAKPGREVAAAQARVHHAKNPNQGKIG
jgi:hypothetical protein